MSTRCYVSYGFLWKKNMIGHGDAKGMMLESKVQVESMNISFKGNSVAPIR
jgi:hypothetical protein